MKQLKFIENEFEDDFKYYKTNFYGSHHQIYELFLEFYGEFILIGETETTKYIQIKKKPYLEENDMNEFLAKYDELLEKWWTANFEGVYLKNGK